jgi:hypothetical protein
MGYSIPQGKTKSTKTISSGEGNSFSLLQVNPSWIIPLDDVILAAVGCSYTAPINSIGLFTNRVP